MQKKTRIVLFSIFLFLFLLICPTFIFYSQGYRFDFATKKITQTGGLFLKVSPKQIEIFLDDNLKKKTDFFFGSVLIENLLPKKYKVTVRKENYHPWEKILEIKEKEVTEAKNVVLIPENPSPSLLATKVKDFWSFPDQKKAIFREEEEEGWALKIYDLEKKVKSPLLKEKEIYSKPPTPPPPSRLGGPLGADLLDLSFSEDSKEIYLEVAMKEQRKSFVLELDKVPPILEEREEKPLPENIIFSKKLKNDSYYLDNQGNIFKNQEKLATTPFSLKKETEYSLEIFSGFIFLQEERALYLLNSKTKSFEKFFEPTKFLKISSDARKLAYSSDFEIWVFFLREEASQPKKIAGERLFIARFSEKINSIFWLTPHYLIFEAGEKIKIAEIDDRDKINIVDLATFPNPKIFWSEDNKKLYVLSEENLYVLESLLP